MPSISEIFTKIFDTLVVVAGLFVANRLWDWRYQKSVTKKAEVDVSATEATAKKTDAEAKKTDAEATHILTEVIADGAKNLNDAYAKIAEVRAESKAKDALIVQTQADILVMRNKLTIYEADTEKRFIKMDGVIARLHEDNKKLHEDNRILQNRVNELTKENIDLRNQLGIPARVLKTV